MLFAFGPPFLAVSYSPRAVARRILTIGGYVKDQLATTTMYNKHILDESLTMFHACFSAHRSLYIGSCDFSNEYSELLFDSPQRVFCSVLSFCALLRLIQ